MQLGAERKSERGVALILSLVTVVVIAGIGALLFARTLNEMQHSRDDAAIVQTLALAQGGMNVGVSLLAHDVKLALTEVVGALHVPGRWSFGQDLSPISDDGPDPVSVVSALAPVLTQLQAKVDEIVCGKEIIPSGSDAAMFLRIHFAPSACGLSLPEGVRLPQGRFVKGPPRGVSEGSQEYALPFAIISEGASGEYRRNIVMQGEYVFQLGQTSFAHYAYFTHHENGSDKRLWFTDGTMIDGPVHTNSHFGFKDDSWFGGPLTTAGCLQRSCVSQDYGGHFYTNHRNTLTKVSKMTDPTAPKFGSDEPNFTGGVDWEAALVGLPENAHEQKVVAAGTGRGDRGLLFTENIHTLELWSGDEEGVNPTQNHAGEWNPSSTHQYVKACTSSNSNSCTTYRYDETRILEELTSTGWELDSDSRPFNGVIYSDKTIDRLTGPNRNTSTDGTTAPPAIASFAEITIATQADIRLTSDLRYEQPPCSSSPVRNANRTVTEAQCSNLEHKNTLGIYTGGGHILVGNFNNDTTLNAPKDVHIHGVLMSGTGSVTVENHTAVGNRGAFNLLGGMIQEERGPFGVMDGRGYDRVYTYDPRMRRGLAPPFFPTTKLQGVTSVWHFQFGTREQMY